MAKNTTETCAVSLDTLRENYTVASTNYARVFRKLRILDAVDKTKLWEAINSRYPKYQILPDTNWVRYIKNNLVASIYTVSKSASILPTNEDDREAVEHINIALEYIWDTCDIDQYQMRAGDHAALLNIGITQVGWDANASGGNGDTFYKGNVVLKDIDPLQFMRDPFASDMNSANYCITWSEEHQTTIMGNPKYRDNFRNYLAKEAAANVLADPVLPITDKPPANIAKGYYTVVIHFVKYNDEEGNLKIAEVHTINNEHILWFNNDIKPSCFPFVELFCNLPGNDIIGVSEPASILSNNIAYNILNSMLLTHEYKNQRPPRFVSSSSGLNVATFSKYSNDADRCFVVNGDASRAVHYHQYPAPSPLAQTCQAMLGNDIQTASGIDGRYTGRDTGSVITTGGVEDMLNRVTLIDTPKIKNYEKYTKQLTKLILANFIQFSMKRTYFKKNIERNTYDKVEVDYSKLAQDTIFHYAINISSELPKNKQRVAAMANALMEKQMQYAQSNNGPDLITTEEWLQLQDLPFKEAMQKRMGIQRMADATEQFAENLYEYAGLMQQGLSPDDAVSIVGENNAARQKGQQPPMPTPDISQMLQANQSEAPVQTMENAIDPSLLQL